MAKISKKAGDEAFKALVEGTPAARRTRAGHGRWKDLKSKHMSPERIAAVEAEAQAVATAMPPRTQDGRAITEERAGELDAIGQMVAEWLIREANQRIAEAARAASQTDRLRYRDAAMLFDSAHVLLSMARDAERCRFLPPDLRPCVDGAGRRGSHLTYVKDYHEGGGMICSFCGRK